MKKVTFVVLALAAAPAFAGQEPAPPGPQAAPPAPAASAPKPAAFGLFVYPAAGQDASKQAGDEGECYTWAGQQTGIDPTAPSAPVPVAEVPKGGTVKGAAGGAVVGTAVGAIASDTGEGAEIGAVAGAARGRRAQKKAEKQAHTQAQQTAKAQDTQTKETFKRAWGACLEGRGYSVK